MNKFKSKMKKDEEELANGNLDAYQTKNVRPKGLYTPCPNDKHYDR